MPLRSAQLFLVVPPSAALDLSSEAVRRSNNSDDVNKTTTSLGCLAIMYEVRDLMNRMVPNYPALQAVARSKYLSKSLQRRLQGRPLLRSALNLQRWKSCPKVLLPRCSKLRVPRKGRLCVSLGDSSSSWYSFQCLPDGLAATSGSLTRWDRQVHPAQQYKLVLVHYTQWQCVSQ
jgi:hypothetical protein